MSQRIRTIYAELKGILGQAPPLAENVVYDKPAIWDHYNALVEKLSNETQNTDYQRFKITPVPWGGLGERAIYVEEYRSKLGGLIASLHSEYFHTESEPFSGTPSTVIQQNQSQSQQQTQTFVVDLAFRIAEAKSEHVEGTPERDFLDGLGEAIRSAKDFSDIMRTALDLASKTGVALSFVKSLF